MIQEAFRELSIAMQQKFSLPTSSHEKLEVTVMTYDEARRRLLVVQAADNGRFRKPVRPFFYLPYGAGLAGACFKDPDSIRGYIKPQREETEPLQYQPFRKMKHQVLLAIPVIVPGFSDAELETEDFERARHCIGVIHVGSDKLNKNLSEAFDLSALSKNLTGPPLLLGLGKATFPEPRTALSFRLRDHQCLPASRRIRLHQQGTSKNAG